MFSIEKSLSQQIRNCLQKTNNLFTQLYLKNIWETTVSNQAFFKKPLAFICYFKKRKQLLKKLKKTNKVFLFSIKMIICAAHERWPLRVNPDYIYKSLLISGKRLSKEEFYEVLNPKMQEVAIKRSTRKSRAYWLAAHKMKGIKEIFYEKSEINSFEDAA